MRVEKLFQSQDNMIQTPEEKKDLRIPSRQEQPMTENGLEASEMDTVFKNGLMALSTRDNGKIIELMEKANSLISMETSMMENGLMIKPMDMVCIIISMELCMRESGGMISNMEKVKSLGLISPCIRENTKPERSMESVFIAGMMDPSMMVNGTRIR